MSAPPRHELQRFWQPFGSAADWTTIATLDTPDAIANGAKMAASAPDTYRLLVNGAVAQCRPDGSYVARISRLGLSDALARSLAILTNGQSDTSSD